MNETYKKLIYLGSPYSHTDNDVVLKRVADVQDATARLIERGWLVFSPIVHSHQIAHLVSFEAVHSDATDFSPGKTWLDYDLAMIEKSDELWVLTIDGWKESRGLRAEMDHATTTHKPIRFVDYPSLGLQNL